MTESAPKEVKTGKGRSRWVKLAGVVTIVALILGLGLLARYGLWVQAVNAAMDSIESGRFMKARDQARQAIAMMSWLPDAKSFALSLRLVSNIYACRRQFQQSEDYNRRLLIFDKKVWGRESVEFADDLAGLALMKRKQRQWVESEGFYKGAIGIYEQHPESVLECARAKALLAWVLVQQTQLDDAIKLIDESDAVLKKQYGEAHWERLVGLVELATIHEKQGKKELHKKEIDAIYRMVTEPKVLEKSSAQTVVVLNLLAQSLVEMGEDEKALQVFEIAEINCRSSVFAGGYNTFMADILEPHAKLLKKLGKDHDADLLLRRAEEIRKIELSQRRSQTAKVMV